MEQNSIVITNVGSKYQIKLLGFLNEDVTFDKIVCSGPEEIEVDFNEVKSINSCGIRNWVNWIKQHSKSKIIYINCPKIIIDQINMVAGFLPKNGIVISFYVPYINENAEFRKYVLFTYGKEFSEKQLSLPDNIRDEKGDLMEIDVIVSKFFRFILK